MPGIEVLVFIIAAVVAGGLSMGGITWVYFTDKRREYPSKGSTSDKTSVDGSLARAQQGATLFDRAA